MRIAEVFRGIRRLVLRIENLAKFLSQIHTAVRLAEQMNTRVQPALMRDPNFSLGGGKPSGQVASARASNSRGPLFQKAKLIACLNNQEN